ncbi:MAG: hypothetical protein ACRD0J_13340 [Acidimicrobiales bacterium]
MPPLVAVELVAACIFVGSLACLAVVTTSARKVLDPPAQVALFRSIGRRYGILGTASLLVAIGCGLALSWPPSTWSGAFDAAVALGGFVVLLTFAGMAQAHAMTALRSRAVACPAEPGIQIAVRRGQALAGAARGAIAVATLAAVVLVARVVAP